MATTAPSAQSPQAPAPVGRWRFPLVAGVCFALGYGVVQRVMDLEFPQLVQLGQSFGVREFSGTGLEALRLRVGAPVQSIRGDLGVLELEQQPSQPSEAAEAAPEPQAPPPAPLLPQAAAPVVSDPSPPELAPAPGSEPSPVPASSIPATDLPDPPTP
jgi:hypothetical protein